MTHCQSHQNICDLLDVFGIEIGEVVVKPRDQSRGAELKQGSRGRQKRKDPRRRGATAIILRGVGRQNCLKERAVFCFTKGELHRCGDAALHIAHMFGKDGKNAFHKSLALRHHKRVTEPLFVAELFVQRRAGDADRFGNLAHPDLIPALLDGEFSCRPQNLFAHMPAERHPHWFSWHRSSIGASPTRAINRQQGSYGPVEEFDDRRRECVVVVAGNHVSRARHVNGLRVRNDGEEMLYCLFGDHVR